MASKSTFQKDNFEKMKFELDNDDLKSSTRNFLRSTREELASVHTTDKRKQFALENLARKIDKLEKGIETNQPMWKLLNKQFSKIRATIKNMTGGSKLRKRLNKTIKRKR